MLIRDCTKTTSLRPLRPWLFPAVHCLGPPRPYLKRRWKILRFLCVELTTIEINLWCLLSVLWCSFNFFLSPGSTVLLPPVCPLSVSLGDPVALFVREIWFGLAVMRQCGSTASTGACRCGPRDGKSSWVFLAPLLIFWGCLVV